MKVFKISERIEVVCDFKKTRNGFKHVATLLLDGQENCNTKICYQNRTWERYEYESVLKQVVEKSSLTDEDKKLCETFIAGDRTDWSAFKTTAMVAKLGDIFCTTRKEKNDWKTRMLKAGLKGLEMPEDWDTLDEETKTKRLDAIIKVASEVGK